MRGCPWESQRCHSHSHPPGASRRHDGHDRVSSSVGITTVRRTLGLDAPSVTGGSVGNVTCTRGDAQSVGEAQRVNGRSSSAATHHRAGRQHHASALCHHRLVSAVPVDVLTCLTSVEAHSLSAQRNGSLRSVVIGGLRVGGLSFITCLRGGAQSVGATQRRGGQSRSPHSVLATASSGVGLCRSGLGLSSVMAHATSVETHSLSAKRNVVGGQSQSVHSQRSVSYYRLG
jgi:hypothetical protein